MRRDYVEGVSDNAEFFVGKEIEKTPAFGLKTLFIVGLQDISEIQKLVEQHHCTHIFFGANHSFSTLVPSASWKRMIYYFLDDYLCSLDVHLNQVMWFARHIDISHDNFILQLRITIPRVQELTKQTTIKIDDSSFASSNPGVWVTPLKDLLDDGRFTSWDEYRKDEIIK